jgi:hypothetical protein
MGSELTGRLRQYSDQAMTVAEKELRSELDRLSKALDRILLNLTFGETRFDNSDIVETIRRAREAACTLDACDVLHWKVLDRDRSTPELRDIDLGGVDDFYQLRDIIDEHRDWITRGFVYVAWRQRARDGGGPFFYVGRAEGNDRLDLNRHTKLALAVKPATLLTIIFPTRSSPNTLAGVEASLLRLLRALDLHPEYNERPEKVPEAVASNHLARLGTFLEGIGALLRGPNSPS